MPDGQRPTSSYLDTLGALDFIHTNLIYAAYT